MKVVSGQKRGNQAEIITPAHPDMTLDVAKTQNANKQRRCMSTIKLTVFDRLTTITLSGYRGQFAEVMFHTY